MTAPVLAYCDPEEKTHENDAHEYDIGSDQLSFEEANLLRLPVDLCRSATMCK